MFRFLQYFKFCWLPRNLLRNRTWHCRWFLTSPQSSLKCRGESRPLRFWTQNLPRDSPKIELWSQQEKSTKCSKFISFKPSKISKFRHFYQLLQQFLTSSLLRFSKLFDFWIFVALESNSSTSKVSGKIKVLKFWFKNPSIFTAFQPFSMPRSHSSWEIKLGSMPQKSRQKSALQNANIEYICS